MKAEPLALRVPRERLGLLFPLLQRGVVLPARVGGTLRSFLCDQLGIPADCVAERILTIFCDGQPVDDLDRTVLREGASIALSGAMPGLVGASMRRGGRYAALRRGISHGEDRDAAAGGEGTVRVKLFNVLLEELGPRLLARGVLVGAGELAALLRDLGAAAHVPPPGAGPVLLAVTFEGPT